MSGLIGGRYELGELLGRGGMAEVRKGTDSRLGRVVAVKRLRTDLASDATFQARFRREAQSAASLNHPAIVAVYDTGEEQTTDGSGVDQPYIVMEFVAGRTLREIIREGRKILPERALEITSGVLSALDYSHRAGIIHRDIKPGNVMLTPSGDVKVMDFGIARAISDASSTMTQTAAVVGTAQYLSPEQARGETVDSRSDVYSAGCLLYELLTGRPPFVGDSPVAVAYQHVREPAAPPSDHDTELPEAIDAIVMKALAKRVEDRYQSAAAMRSDIERYLAGRPIHAVPPPPPPPHDDRTMVATPRVSDPSGPTARDDDEERSGSRAGLWFLLGLLLVLLIGGAAYLLPQLFESPPEQDRVPNVIGMRENQARNALGAAGFTVEVDYRNDDTVDAGKVIEQQPNADQFETPGSEVTIVVSEGAPLTDVPYVLNQPRSVARETLEAQDFEVIMTVRDSDEPKDQVIETDPAPGTEVPVGSSVTVYYSDGPEKVPDVVGEQQEDAERILTEAGFEVDVLESTDTTEPQGTVIRQNPEGGESADEGETVLIVVSAFEEPTEEPSDTETPTETPGLPGGPSTPPGPVVPPGPAAEPGTRQRMGSA